MNELCIYKKLKYRQIIKRANNSFANRKKNPFLFKTVFAQQNEAYSISIDKNLIRICYWDENSNEGISAKKKIIKFLSDSFSGETIFISKNGKCDILNDLDNIKTIQIK